MATKRCRECNGRFTPKHDHHHTCFPCWKAQQSDDDGLELELAAARRRIADLERRLAAPSTPAIPPDILRTLIQLTHPDRHNNSQAATRATAWLLSIRQQSERA